MSLVRQCCVCKLVLGEMEDGRLDRRVTHTYCRYCELIALYTFKVITQEQMSELLELLRYFNE